MVLGFVVVGLIREGSLFVFLGCGCTGFRSDVSLSAGSAGVLSLVAKGAAEMKSVSEKCELSLLTVLLAPVCRFGMGKTSVSWLRSICKYGSMPNWRMLLARYE